jgi:hypothetical protein
VEQLGWPGALRVAAGRSDAAALGASWVPITVEPPADPPTEEAADHGLLFVGSLSYAPNIAALRRLARLWPTLQGAKRDISLLVAGARPAREVHGLARRHGWTLVPDFEALSDVVARCRVGVVPLLHAAGIQMKVLDVAATGRAQVVSPAAAAGLDEAFPVRVARTDELFCLEVLDLLRDAPVREREAHAARHHVGSVYAASRWADWLNGVTAG